MSSGLAFAFVPCHQVLCVFRGVSGSTNISSVRPVLPKLAAVLPTVVTHLIVYGILS